MATAEQIAKASEELDKRAEKTRSSIIEVFTQVLVTFDAVLASRAYRLVAPRDSGWDDETMCVRDDLRRLGNVVRVIPSSGDQQAVIRMGLIPAMGKHFTVIWIDILFQFHNDKATTFLASGETKIGIDLEAPDPLQGAAINGFVHTVTESVLSDNTSKASWANRTLGLFEMYAR